MHHTKPAGTCIAIAFRYQIKGGSMRLAQIPNRVVQLAQDCEVTERVTDASRKLGELSGKVYDRMSVAGETAKKGAAVAYRAALTHPKTSIGGIIIAAALVGGL